MKTALVLSGGSIKGSFQAGAIAEVLDQGFVPDAIYGTSVGSLNGAFLTERAGRDKRDGKEPNWPAIGRQLESFWLENITASDKIAKKRGVLALVRAIIGKKFDGLVDMSPMQELVKQELDPDNLRASPVQFYACAVDLATGAAIYAPHDGPDALDYVIASTAIPIEMPVKMIGQGAFVDGGVREVAPLRRAVDEGAEQIVCIVCQPEAMGGATFDRGDLLQFAFRVMDIVTNELATNDLKVFAKVNARVDAFKEAQAKIVSTLADAGLETGVVDKVNEQLGEMPFGEWRHIPIQVIRPEQEIVLDLLTFTPTEIRQVVQLGRTTARKVLAKE